MNQRIEFSTSSERPEVVARAMNNYFENMLEVGTELAEQKGCASCTHLALCGIAISALRLSASDMRPKTAEILTKYGIEVNDDVKSVCPDGLVKAAIQRNESNDFWLLKADELNGATLEVRAAQTVVFAIKHVRQAVNNKSIV